MEDNLRTGGAPDSHPGDRDAWKPVIMGQVCGELLPPHPEPPEAPEDELTQAALSDPDGLDAQEHDPSPTLWRLVVLVLIAVGALSIVFRFAR